MVKKTSKKKKIKPKNPYLSWLCFKCHQERSSKKFGRVINSISLKCSLCDVYLEIDGVDDGNTKNSVARCPDCSTFIRTPLCFCGEAMLPCSLTLEELEGYNPIENDLPKPEVKKSWWEKL